MNTEYAQLLTQARDKMDMDERVQAALLLAKAGRIWEEEGKPDRAMAVYQIAHELGMNAAPAQNRLAEAGAKLNTDYLRECRRFLGGLDFPQPDVNFLHQVKPMVNMMWHVAEEALDWMTTFTDEQLAKTPWPAEGYQRLKELIDPNEPMPDPTTPTGWQLWRTHAPVAGMWAFLEVTRKREQTSEAIYRAFMTVGGQGARLYRRISMARHFLTGFETETLVKLVGASPASQHSAFAAFFIWDLLNPEKSEPDWPTRAKAYTSEPALVVLTGMFSTLLEKFEGILLLRLEPQASQ